MLSSSGLKEKTQEILKPFAENVGSLGISPNAITVAGFLLSAISGILFGLGNLFQGTVLLALSGACDVFDGILARTTKRASRFGAFLDSFLDRYADFFPLSGLLYLGHSTGNELLLFGSLFSIAGSFATSYARARAESLGAECRSGIFERPERVILLLLGLIIGYPAETTVILAVLSNLTAIQRLICASEKLR